MLKIRNVRAPQWPWFFMQRTKHKEDQELEQKIGQNMCQRMSVKQRPGYDSFLPH